MYKHTSNNCYPEISMHDSVAFSIYYENSDLVFHTHGFTLSKDLHKNSTVEFLLTDDAEFRLKNADPWGLYVRKLSNFRVAKGIALRRWKYLSNEVFFENVISGKWIFEFVDEYYSSNKYQGFRSAIFCGNIISGEKPPYRYTETQIEVKEYKESQYSWSNTIQDDLPF